MLITIVIPSFNQASFVQRAIAGILTTREVPVQALVLDAASTDGTVDLLRSIEDPRLTWVSEPDRGQSDAINKGMRRATGDIVTWLNSDDLYVPGALQAVAEAFERHPEAQWLIGRCQIIDENDRVIRRAVTAYKDYRLRRYSYASLLRENYISQMGVFWRRGFGERVAYPNGNLLDESLHYAMDYDLWLRMGRLAEPLILDRVLGQFRVHGGSKTHSNHRAQFEEQQRVVERYWRGSWRERQAHRLHILGARLGYSVLQCFRR